ncbi:PREDICTED: adenylyl-sulfate kinase 3 isoform X1 [Fragaria vesca subsp. vesca]|uniref:adenylyl-sulfate kinase 3 isoform X1 n=2 Tax=Fragaria vesca subsp. vesca TaxID=101020 RepID=UPI0002C3045A|nr:PREDICTED: adenylyl-sulfate kinase 3 isoform X1 [Fragaria vesca subsp. vesca]
MNAVKAARPSSFGLTPSDAEFGSPPPPARLGFVKVNGSNVNMRLSLSGGVDAGSKGLRPIKATEDQTVSVKSDRAAINAFISAVVISAKALFVSSAIEALEAVLLRGKNSHQMSTAGNSTNIVWHKCAVEKVDRQQLLKQKGCVIWITGLSGSGKSTVACALSQGLHIRGKLTYILDGDNVRHGLNRDLGFKAEDRAENIRRIAEVAKLFADAGIICIASLISPYRKDREACRALFPEGDFIEVFMDVPLNVCENRDPKGLYKLARAGKIKGFTGVDDPYEPPLNCEIVLQQKGRDCVSPSSMAETVISYLEEKGYLQA